MTLIDIRNRSDLLNNLYKKYSLDRVEKVGELTDRLGDVYEEFVLEVFKSIEIAMSWSQGTTERYIVDALFSDLGLKPNDIVGLKASNKGIPSTVNNGSPKTDVYLEFMMLNGENLLVPISVKQSTRSKVAFAEYSVDTIVSALNIQDPILIGLLMKHQTDASAKNFTNEEKEELTSRLDPYVNSLVRWCITLNPEPTKQNICHPEYVIRFDLNNPKISPNYRYCLKSSQVYSIDQYMDFIRHTPSGKLRSGGFGTGLSWTYATGSKGKKIQFKG